MPVPRCQGARHSHATHVLEDLWRSRRPRRTRFGPSLLLRRDVRLRHVVHVREGPDPPRDGQARQPAVQMIAAAAVDEIGFRLPSITPVNSNTIGAPRAASITAARYPCRRQERRGFAHVAAENAARPLREAWRENTNGSCPLRRRAATIARPRSSAAGDENALE